MKTIRRQLWEAFVQEAVGEKPDDPHVRLLRDRLRSGAKVMRVQLVSRSKPEYVVVLERLRELTEQRVPHSRSFTRWSFAEGVRMADEAEEVERFALLLGEAFAPIEDNVGRDYFKTVLHERIRELNPPHAGAMVAKLAPSSAQEGPVREHARRDLDDVLRARCEELTGALRYSEAETAVILDRALAAWINDRSHSTERERLFGVRRPT